MSVFIYSPPSPQPLAPSQSNRLAERVPPSLHQKKKEAITIDSYWRSDSDYGGSRNGPFNGDPCMAWEDIYIYI